MKYGKSSDRTENFAQQSIKISQLSKIRILVIWIKINLPFFSCVSMYITLLTTAIQRFGSRYKKNTCKGDLHWGLYNWHCYWQAILISIVCAPFGQQTKRSAASVAHLLFPVRRWAQFCNVKEGGYSFVFFFFKLENRTLSPYKSLYFGCCETSVLVYVYCSIGWLPACTLPSPFSNYCKSLHWSCNNHVLCWVVELYIS